jgi:hypothetical protein
MLGELTGMASGSSIEFRELRTDAGEKGEVKKESHAARWGLMRGYSGKATKWVDFVKAGSTQRKREEPCPKRRLRKFRSNVKCLDVDFLLIAAFCRGVSLVRLIVAQR